MPIAKPWKLRHCPANRRRPPPRRRFEEPLKHPLLMLNLSFVCSQLLEDCRDFRMVQAKRFQRCPGSLEVFERNVAQAGEIICAARVGSVFRGLACVGRRQAEGIGAASPETTE